MDPRRSDTVKALADQWIPLRPTTDNALMDAMLWVMITEKLYDEDFLRAIAWALTKTRCLRVFLPGTPW